MEQNKLQTYKTKFRVLLWLAGIILALFIVNLFPVFKNNQSLMEHSSGILMIIYMALLVIIFILILNNLFSFVQLSKTIIEENIALKAEKLKFAKTDKESKEEKLSEQAEEGKQVSIFEEAWNSSKKEKDVEQICETFLIELSNKIELVQGLFYLFDKKEKKYKIAAKYAYYSDEEPASFEIGEGLSGQVAKDMNPMQINELPEKYMTILSGLGSSAPTNLLILPVIHKNTVIGVIELASFVKFEFNTQDFVEFLKGVSESLIQDKRNTAKK